MAQLQLEHANSARLARSAYSCGWPGAPQPLRRAVLIVMCRTQRPLSLTAGKFYTISRTTFVRSEATGMKDKDIPWSDTSLWLVARVLALGGSWRPPGVPGFTLYRIWVLFTQFSFLYGQVQGVFYFWGDANKVIQDVCLLVTTILGIIKFIIFVVRQEDVFKIVRTIDDRRREQSALGNARIAAILARSYRSATRITVHMALIGGWLPVVFAITPSVIRAFGVGPPERELPATAWYTGRDSATPIYELLSVLQYFSMQYSHFAAMCIDLFFACLIIHVAAQLEVLNVRITQIGEDIYRNGHVSESPAGTRDEGTEEDSAWRELCECVEHHKDVIKLVGDLEGLANIVILSQFMGATIIICVTLFVITTSKQHFAALVKLDGYLVVVVYEIFMYCWFGDDIMYQNSRLVNSVYMCGWPGAPQKMQKALIIILLRAQRPLGVTAGKFYHVSRRAFVSLLKASYSYYALLNQMNK
ncbi:odorant receptor Or2-like [Schistocerca cancellata]|uniref:odorant receptor Or2-like n=1 Tax=Schistocerca cancellata TaxID=274614 RepID=UPI0021194A72|nr:odorant receptor Or2-like [Schistocerca cancellata]